MDDDFDIMFGDEMDALEDMDDDRGGTTKGRKSLNFSTPSTQHIRQRITNPDQSLDDEIPFDLPPDSPAQSSTVTSGKENLPNGRESSRKRTQDEMFGKLSDDENEDALCIDADIPEMEPVSKKARTQKTPAKGALPSGNSADVVITPPPSPSDDITAIKRQNQRQTMETAIQRLEREEQRLLQNYDFERKRVFKRMPPGAFIPATGEEGGRVYMRLKSQENLTREITHTVQGQKSLQLLGTPLYVLKAHMEEQRRRKLLQESERLTQIINRVTDDYSDDNTKDEVENLAEKMDHALWVERYAPHNYTELLSDESTNRTLLKWLKLWDYVVFNKERKDKEKKKILTKEQQKKVEQQKFFNRNLPEINEELDQHKRPMQKVALLSGPPGLGKTTLAHVIARHAGYNVVEMNASDDRSPDIFKQRIEAATQMKAVIGEDPRPNCLIIDEIDGAPQPAINMLLSLVKQGDKENTQVKKKKRESGPLLRPIICICNDLYVPALRQLRQVALVVNFPQTLAPKLAGRLIEIARRENIKADLSTLLALCEKADNDIRSCLNTLQFAKSKCSELTLQSVTSMSLGQKDAHKSLFSVWQHIFTMPRPKRKRYVNPHDRATAVVDEMEELALTLANNNTSLSARFHNTLQMAMAAGENHKVMQGLFENYLESKAKDPRMDGVQLASEWLGFVDILDKEIGHSQNYGLMRYTSYLPVVFHLLFAANQPQKIQYPHSQQENYMKLSRSENLLTSMLNEVMPSVRKNLNITVTVSELLPPLLAIIQPTLRPVNTQLYSAREKEGLCHLVRIMISYNMNYHQERNAEGQYNYVLDPNMDDVVRFPGLKPSKQLTYAAKQLISREIELEKMRRSEAALGSRSRDKPSTPAKPAPSKAAEGQPAELPNHLRQTLQPKAIIEDKPDRDFFGRKIHKITHDTQAKTTKSQKPKQEIIGGDIWFRFKEGFTNAVRKTVRVQDLI